MKLFSIIAGFHVFNLAPHNPAAPATHITRAVAYLLQASSRYRTTVVRQAASSVRLVAVLGNEWMIKGVVQVLTPLRLASRFSGGGYPPRLSRF